MIQLQKCRIVLPHSTYEEQAVATVPNENNSDKEFPIMENQSTVVYLQQRVHICKITSVQFTLLRSVTVPQEWESSRHLRGGSKVVLLTFGQHQRP